MHDGFILRAVGDKKNCVVTVMEMPAYLAGAFSGRDTAVGLFVTTVSIKSASLASSLKYGASFLDVEPVLGQHSRGVSIGTSAAWTSDGAVRGAIAHVMPSAVLAAIAPDVGGTANVLVMYRTNGQTKFGLDDEAAIPGANMPALGPNGNTGVGTIGYVELGLGALYPFGGAGFIRRPSACLEWGARSGIATGVVTVGDDDVLAIAKYAITEAAVSGDPLHGEIEWSAHITGGTIPDAPAPSGIGKMRFELDMGMARMWSAGAGYAGREGEAVMVLGLLVDADEGLPYPYSRHIAYVLTLAVDGTVSYLKIHDYHAARYNLAVSPPGAVDRETYYALQGINTREGSPRIACFVLRTQYVIETGGDEPPRRAQSSAPMTLAANTAYAFVDTDGVRTAISTPGYFIRASMTSTDLRYDSLVPEMMASAAVRSASSVDQACANYAPGVMAAIVTPAADFGTASHRYHVAAIDVATGVMLAIGPALPVPSTLITGGWLSCVEQGTIDEDTGDIATHAVLLFTISRYDDSPHREDGTYVIRELGAEVDWICREPSNVGLHYVGSPISPARIGVSTSW